MASVNRKTLLSATALTATSTVGDAHSLEEYQVINAASIVVSAIHADTTATGIIETSHDGTNWFTLVSFTAVAAAVNKELKAVTVPALSKVRYSVTLAGTTKAATVEIDLHYGR